MRFPFALSSLPVFLCLCGIAGAGPPNFSDVHRTRTVYGATDRSHYQPSRHHRHVQQNYAGRRINFGGGGYAYRPYSHYLHPHSYSGYSSFFGYRSSFVIGPAGYADYGPVYSYIPMAPVVIQGHPQILGPNPFNNSVLRDARRENERRWAEKLIVEPQLKTVERPIRESTPAAKLKSLRAQAQGDEWFRKEEYLKAYARYKVAIAEADDLADAHFRLAYVLVALGRYERAVAEMKRGLRIDPAWPVTGKSLSLVFGAENLLAKATTVSRVTAWVREDIRDPDRLFLVGVLLHFDDDDRAAKFFETAIRLAGGGDHLLAFLRKSEPAKNPLQKQPLPPPDAAGPALPPLPAP